MSRFGWAFVNSITTGSAVLGPNYAVVFNNGGYASSSADFAFNPTTKTGSLNGVLNVTGTLSASSGLFTNINATVVSGTSISYTRVTGSTVTGSNAIFSVITGSTITGLTAIYSVVSGSTITGSTAIYSVITGSTITGSTATYSVMSATTITGSTITGSNAIYSVVSGSTVTGSLAKYTTISGSVITGSGAATFASVISDTVDINGGNIDGTTIATSDITVGSGKTLNVSAGTLTLGAGQVTADKVGAGTFNAGTYSFNGSTITTANFSQLSASTNGLRVTGSSGYMTVGHQLIEIGNTVNTSTAKGMRMLSGSTERWFVGMNTTDNFSIKLSASTNAVEINGSNYGITLAGDLTASQQINNLTIGLGTPAGAPIETGSLAIGYGSTLAPLGNSILGAIRNTAIGTYSLSALTNGDDNVAVGNSALLSVTVSGQNTAVGFQALSSVASTLSTEARYNTAIGYGAGSTITTGQNNTCVGNDAEPVSATTNNSITLGQSSVTSLRCAVTTITAISDMRDKKDIVDLPVGLSLIKDLRPVQFTWDSRDGKRVGIKEYGFIAQELDQVQQKYNNEEYLNMVLKENPDRLEASPMRTYPVLVKAVQELSTMVEQLRAEIEILKNK